MYPVKSQEARWNEAEFDEGEEEDEVQLAIEKIKTQKAPGRSNIVGEFVKYGRTKLVKSLQILFQKAWDEKKIPTDWEYNVIIPIHKKCSPAECSN